eukprot:8709656-Alexandrium_andersonii.AAC.1
MTKSRSSGLLAQGLPSGLGRTSNAPAGRTPSRWSRAAAAMTRGGEKTSATDARASPGIAPAAKRALARPAASSGGAPVRTLGPRSPSL